MNYYEIQPLSEREKQVCDLLIRGKTMQEIADHMGLAYKTIAAFKARIYQKYQVRSTLDLYRFHIRQKLESADFPNVSYMAGYRDALDQVLCP